jgi:nucleotide-binding universal stress UspA family protein
MTIKTVYVPLDGSERAETALVPAAALAARANAALVLMTTRWPHDGPDTPRNYLDVRAGFLDQAARTWLILDRDPSDAILLAAEASEALVCMATHGRGGLRQAVLGSVAESVVRRARTPLVLVGPDFDPHWELTDSPLVVAGVDGSAASRAVAIAAGRLVLDVGGRVCVEEVLQPSEFITTSRATAADVAVLEEITDDLARRGVSTTHILRDGFDAADTLVHDVAEQRAQFLAVASHGRSGLARAVLGSVTARAVRHVPCPLLVTGPACVVDGGERNPSAGVATG